MKHTKGKWNVKEIRENLNGLSSFVSYQVVNDDEVVIAKETTEANANLIASAPEMLELLKKCYAGEIEEPYNNDELNAFISKVEERKS